MPQLTRLLTGTAFVLFCVYTNAQVHIDSLKRELDQGWDQAMTTDLLNQIARQYEHISSDSSITYASEALSKAVEIGYSSGQLEAYSILALTYANMGQFDLARSMGREGLSLAQKLGELLYMAKLSSQIGRTYGRQGSYHGALHYFKEALNINKTVGDVRLNAALYNSIGSMYVYLEEYDLAAEYYEKSLELYEAMGDRQQLSGLYVNIAGNYYYLEDWDQSLSYYQQALAIYQDMDLQCLEVVATYNIGGIYLKMNKLSLADEFLNRALDMGASCDIGDLNAHLLHELGVLADRLGKAREARERFDGAMEELSANKNYYTYSLITKTIYEFYDKRNDSDKALYYLELHNEAKDSLRKQADLQKLAQLTSEYEFNKEREALKAEQEKAELLMQGEIANERAIRNLVVALAVFLVILALSYYRTSRIRHQANRQLKEQNDVMVNQKLALEQKTSELTKTNLQLNKLSEFKENLTHMIAHDLKNALNSILAASGKAEERKMQVIHQSGANALRLITNMLDVHKFEEADMILNSQAIGISQVIKEARLQVFLLLEFKKLNLVVDQETEVICELDSDLILRVLVNLLTNAIKYSEPGATIRLSTNYHIVENGPELHLEVQDSGEGISGEDLPHIFDKHWSGNSRNLHGDVSTGLGLTFCKMAIEAHRGEIYARSGSEKGTVFVIHLPAVKTAPLDTTTSAEAEAHKDSGAHARSINEVLRPFALKLQDIGVHEVSRITTLLREIHELELDSEWLRELELAMYHGDQEGFDSLVNGLLDQ